jgi:hypothetical protein
MLSQCSTITDIDSWLYILFNTTVDGDLQPKKGAQTKKTFFYHIGSKSLHIKGTISRDGFEFDKMYG